MEKARLSSYSFAIRCPKLNHLSRLAYQIGKIMVRSCSSPCLAQSGAHGIQVKQTHDSRQREMNPGKDLSHFEKNKLVNFNQSEAIWVKYNWSKAQVIQA